MIAAFLRGDDLDSPGMALSTFGALEEMQKQMTYALERALVHATPGELQAQCSVVEVAGREG